MSHPKYLLTERVARGGMAEIWLGRLNGSDDEFRKVCAFKRILPEYSQDEEFMQMFRNEAMVAKMLQNKNIVQVFDFDTEDPRCPILVMEYVDGQDLRAVLQETERLRERIPIPVACFIVMEMLNGLRYAHEAVDHAGKSLGIIHRDISPQNILISYEGDVKITDFGIAKVQSQASLTRAGVLKGKFRYMSPEQARGKEIDRRTDLFATGIILYEMLTMTSLFKRDSDVGILEAVRSCEVRPPNSVRGANLPPALEALVMRFLQKDPDKRFPGAGEAAREISKFLYGFKPDFHQVELVGFMRHLFAEKIEKSRARIRNTMSLSDEISTPGFGEIVAGQGKPFEEYQPGPVGNSHRDQGGQRIPPALPGRPAGVVGKKGFSNSELSIELGAGASEKLELASGAGISPLARRDAVARLSNYPNSPNARSAQQARGESKAAKSGSFEQMLIGFTLVLIALAVAFAVGLKMKVITFQSELKLVTYPQRRVQVEFDGRPWSGGHYVMAPIVLAMEAGPHQVLLRRNGFKPKKVVFNAGLFGTKAEETVVLEPAQTMGTMQIVSTPPGATVTLGNGLDVGVTPVTFEFLPIGSAIAISFSHPRCKPLSLDETIPASAETRVYTRSVNLQGCE